MTFTPTGGVPVITLTEVFSMPKGQPSNETRIQNLKRMNGTDWAMAVGSDLLLLQPPEQEKALKLLSALRDTVARETQPAATR